MEGAAGSVTLEAMHEPSPIAHPRRPASAAPKPERLPRRADAFMVPRPVPGRPGQFLVDATWGTIRPMRLAPGVRTVGELDVIEHVARGLPLVDSRLPHYLEGGTLPGAISIPHGETAARLDAFDPEVDTILFCNGPQCAATPDAIATLLAAGHPPERILYYRGGLHDWLTLGLPLEAPDPAPPAAHV
jgi:rhodanese-related sulfurtransferase